MISLLHIKINKINLFFIKIQTLGLARPHLIYRIWFINKMNFDSHILFLEKVFLDSFEVHTSGLLK